MSKWKQAQHIYRRGGWRSHSPSSGSSIRNRSSSSANSLKDHYLELSEMTPPPKVNPPPPYSIIKGALDRDGPVLQREYKGQEISISVMRLSNIMPAGAEDDDAAAINQLFLHVDVSKPDRKEGIHFPCGFYPGAIEILGASQVQG